MQPSQLLILASVATALAKVYDDNSPIPASVKRPVDTVKLDAGTAFGTISARLRAKSLQARAATLVICEHSNFQGNCATIAGIQSGGCCRSLS